MLQSNSDTEQILASRHWNYCVQLLKYMYEEGTFVVSFYFLFFKLILHILGLMDRQEVLNWILDLLEKVKSQQPADDGILKLYLPLMLQYLDEFVQSELLSRRLTYLCCKKISYMLNNVAENNLITSPHSETKPEPKENEKDKKELLPNQNPIQSTLLEYQNCPHHRDISNLFCLICFFYFNCSFENWF